MSGPGALSGRRILVVETTQSLPLALQGTTGTQVTVARYAEITRKFLDDLCPDIVIAPLIAQDHDILDLALLLRNTGFAGALRAFTRPLPNSAIIRAEVASIYPHLDFDVIELSGPMAPKRPY
ncbi:MAG: hypothetical protein KDJ82_09675 [Rhodobacteraceae bacterium]|nr:hypothetical protein [Paracoccaceae bacterium]